jgi:transposase
MRFVPIKTADQQAVLLLHRTRDLLIRQRSSLLSAIRAHFAEFGVVVGQRMRNIDQVLGLLVKAGTTLPALAPRMLAVLAYRLPAARRLGPSGGRAGGAAGLASSERGEPTAGHHPRGGTDHRERHCGDGRRCSSVQLRPAVRGLAGARAATAIEWRQRAPRPHLQARRRVYSSPDGSRRAGSRRLAQTPSLRPRPLAGWAVGTATLQRCDCGIRQQERSHCLGTDGARPDLQHRPSARRLIGTRAFRATMLRR